MPKIDLTMNQWGLVLRTIRYKLSTDELFEEDIKELKIVEDRIIDMAFKLAKETEEASTAKKEVKDRLDHPNYMK